MSPRAAWRLETLGFEEVYDYVGGKADWLAHGLPREGKATIPNAGDLADRDAPTCTLSESLDIVQARLAASQYRYCLVVNEQHVLLGRLRGSALLNAGADATVEQLLEPGPSTVRPNEVAEGLARRLATKQLHTAIVTTPDGALVGVFHRADAERGLARAIR